MGAQCPNGHGRQNVIVQITPDASNPIRAAHVVAWKLQCGCVVGGEKYDQFKKAADQIDKEKTAAISAIEQEARNKKAAAYQGFVLTGGENHAE
jgi:hypothetical protein